MDELVNVVKALKVSYKKLNAASLENQNITPLFEKCSIFDKQYHSIIDPMICKIGNATIKQFILSYLLTYTKSGDISNGIFKTDFFFFSVKKYLILSDKYFKNRKNINEQVEKLIFDFAKKNISKGEFKSASKIVEDTLIVKEKNIIFDLRITLTNLLIEISSIVDTLNHFSSNYKEKLDLIKKSIYISEYKRGRNGNYDSVSNIYKKMKHFRDGLCHRDYKENNNIRRNVELEKKVNIIKDNFFCVCTKDGNLVYSLGEAFLYVDDIRLFLYFLIPIYIEAKYKDHIPLSIKLDYGI